MRRLKLRDGAAARAAEHAAVVAFLERGRRAVDDAATASGVARALDVVRGWRPGAVTPPLHVTAAAFLRAEAKARGGSAGRWLLRAARAVERGEHRLDPAAREIDPAGRSSP